jgi:hypothetical protein
MPWLVIAAALGGCAAEQPPECQAYLSCYFPEDGSSPYVGTGNEDLLDDRQTIIALYGESGECWANGLDDQLAQACFATCAGRIEKDCDAAGAGEPHPCVGGAGDTRVFSAPSAPSLEVQCSDVEGAWPSPED